MHLYVICFVVSLSVFTNGEVSDIGCGTSKTCFKWPSSCVLTASNCRFLSWKKSPTSDNFTFEMRSNLGSGKYHAFAFGEQPAMANSDVYVCTSNGMLSGAIEDYAGPVLASYTVGFTAISHARKNNSLQCIFTRAKTVSRTIGGYSTNFDIQSKTYHILMSVGVLDGDYLMEHFDRYVTQEKFNFSTPLKSTVTTVFAITAANASTIPVYPVTRNDTNKKSTTTSQTTTGIGVVIADAGCGITKTCLRYPPNCNIASSSCKFVSWIRTSDYYEFEVSVSAENRAEYIAIGFALTNQMKDADVYICNGTALTSAVIAERHSHPVNLLPTGGISLVRAGTNNGIAQCVFRRPPSVTKTTRTKNEVFDLDKLKYYLLVAVGNTNGSEIQKHSWRTVSEGQYDFSGRNSAKRNILLNSWLFSGIVILTLNRGI